MTALLTDNLPLLAGAPNGIKKLRELILELAVRGKLVPQDPSDEPASELLKRIAEEKARSVAAGKKVKRQADINDKEQPFSVPQGWSWVRLGSCLEMINGRAFKPTEWIAAGLPIVRIQNLNKPDAPFNYCDPDTVDDRHIIDTGTILISWSGTPGTSFGAFIWERGKAALNQHIFSCSQVGDAFFDKFLKLAINTRLEELIAKAHGGVGLQHVTKGKLEALTLVLPPLAEQHRIVAKVDELMALCDRLEAQQADADSAHAQLVQALLDSLTQARDAEDFTQSWQRLAEHFHILFTTESSIDALKQAFLCLAADGRLVRSCIPADYLSLSDVIEGDSLNGSSKKPQDLPGVVEILRISAGTGVAGYVTDEFEHKWADVSEAEIQKFLLAKDDLLACRFNGNLHYVGAFSLYCGSRGVPQIFPDKLIRFRADRNKASPHYLKYILNAAPARAQIESFCATTVGNIGISAKNLKTIKLRLPTLDEQSNIVSRLDQLMALCDQLKARLNQARQVHEQLANALVEQAIA